MKSYGIENTKKILDLSKVDAVFSANDVAAISAMICLKDKGVKIPDEIAFVGFSNEQISVVIEPSLSTISQSDVKMGAVVATLLFKQIEQETTIKEGYTKILEPKLIIRNSSQKIIL